MFTIVHEDIVLDQRGKEREEKGYHPRRHVTGVSASGSHEKRVYVTNEVEELGTMDLSPESTPTTFKTPRKVRRENHRRLLYGVGTGTLK